MEGGKVSKKWEDQLEETQLVLEPLRTPPSHPAMPLLPQTGPSLSYMCVPSSEKRRFGRDVLLVLNAACPEWHAGDMLAFSCFSAA